MRRFRTVKFLFFISTMMTATTYADLVVGEKRALSYITHSESFNGSCKASAKPDIAVISGGFSAQAIKPTDANKQIDNQLAAVKKYVKEIGGQLIVLEKIRSARTLVDKRSGGGLGEQALPFMLIQRIEVLLPLDISVDRVLEKLLQLGLDRFGNQLRVDYVDQNFRTVVSYRFTDFVKTFETVRQQCLKMALKEKCAKEPNHAICKLPNEAVARAAIVQNVNLQTQSVLNRDGYPNVISIYYPGILPQIDLAGDITLHFQGTINVLFPQDNAQ